MINTLIAPTPTINNIKTAVGLLLIATAVLILDPAKRYPGWCALLPVAGTYLMISAGPRAWINNRVLATPVLVAIGLISYPLYLWHWPLLSFDRIIEGKPPSGTTAAPTILASFVLASLTYFLVEKPIRLATLSPVKTSLPLIVAMGVIGAADMESTWRRAFHCGRTLLTRS